MSFHRVRVVSLGLSAASQAAAARRGASALPVLTQTVRSLTSTSSPRAILAATAPVRTHAFPAIVSTTTRRFASTEAGKKLASALADEKAFEAENPMEDSHIKEALKKLPFKVHDTPRKMEVSMTRKFEGEDITVFFTVEPKPPVDHLDSEEGEENPEEGDEEANLPPTFFSVLVSNPTGTVTFNCTADYGSLTINQVVFTGDSKLAIEDTAQADYARTNIYPGPNFDDLDERLQDALYDFLLERIGDEEEFCNFIPDYIDYKEQQEYQNWLADLEKFLGKK